MSSDPSLRRGPSAGESDPKQHPIWLLANRIDASLRAIRQCTSLDEAISLAAATAWITAEIRGRLNQLAASPPAGDSRLITKEEDAVALPGNTGLEEPQALRLQPQPDNATERLRARLLERLRPTLDDWDTAQSLLRGPCVFCDYVGANYWQRGSHAESCPWRDVGGIGERSELVAGIVASWLRGEAPSGDAAKRQLERADRVNPDHPSAAGDSPQALREAAICEACGHLWRFHTMGGMCQGTAKGIECHCCLIPDADDLRSSSAGDEPREER